MKLKATVTLALEMRENETAEEAADRLYDLLYEGICQNAEHCCDFWIENADYEG